jgi:hypothetical protein
LPRRFTLIDVPDLTMLPAQFPGLKNAWVGAATVPAALHRVLGMMAWLVRIGLLRSLAPFAAWMHRAHLLLRWGEDRGGMFVAVAGVGSDGRRIAWVWHMIVEGDDGPFIPAMAAAALVRRVLDGDRPAAGARAGTADVRLADYAPQFAARRIAAGVRESAAEPMPLYRQLLGTAFDALPDAIRRMHDFDSERIAEGRASVDRGTGWIARTIANRVGFPPAGDSVPLVVTFRQRLGRWGRHEVWRRNFDGHVFGSIQEAGRGRFDRLLCERFGPCAFGFALVVDGDCLRLVLRGWSVYGLPLPLWLAPACEAYEWADEGGFRFFVELSYPLAGLIVRYQGWLEPRD